MSRFTGPALVELVLLANALQVQLDPGEDDAAGLRHCRVAAQRLRSTLDAFAKASEGATRAIDALLSFPGGDVDISGMKAEPVAPTTLSDPEDCIR